MGQEFLHRTKNIHNTIDEYDLVARVTRVHRVTLFDDTDDVFAGDYIPPHHRQEYDIDVSRRHYCLSQEMRRKISHPQYRRRDSTGMREVEIVFKAVG